MARASDRASAGPAGGAPVRKVPTGIDGFDELTGGGLPRGRPTLVYGSAGCGKTLFGMEFLIHGVTRQGENGVFVSFEETAEELVANAASLQPSLAGLIAAGKILVDYVHVDRSEIEETGEYDLAGLFVRLDSAIEEVGARRVVLDSIETIFSGLGNTAILRAELKRLFRWLKGKGVTAVITGESGQDRLTRHGLEDFVSDCVVRLDHRITEEFATRRLRVVKYRGSTHGTNEYPFLIDDRGQISVQPITSIGLEYPVSTERISTGVPGLDAMLGGHGFYRGSTILASGTAGTGKTSLAAGFADATCRKGEPCLYFAFEESKEQLVRNMRSIGIDLGRWVKKGLLHVSASRPTLYGLEMHLVQAHRLIEQHRPSAVVVDPISNLVVTGTLVETRSMLTRLVDFVKTKGITGFFTTLSPGGMADRTDEEISSLIDTWVQVRDLPAHGWRKRTLSIVKSRGMPHSSAVHQLTISGDGLDVAVAPEPADGRVPGMVAGGDGAGRPLARAGGGPQRKREVRS